MPGALLVLAAIAASTAIAAPDGIPPPPPPQGVPAPGPQTDQPYQPTALAPGGVVVTLYPPASPQLNGARIHEAEHYGSYNPPFLGYIVNIHNPSIEFHAANGALNTGSAVIIAAGGGHKTLGVAGEGVDMIDWFTSRGISALILRNRLRADGYEPATDAVSDALQAIKLTRAYAADWRINPDRIGFLGFSAGAELAARASLEYEAYDEKHDTPDNPLAKISSRPDFVGLVYPGPSPFAFGGAAAAIPRDAPPAFIASPGWGDWIHAQWASEFFAALLRDGVPNAEMHIYARGVHPGDKGQPGQPPGTAGITSRDGVAFGEWEARFQHWLRDLGFMDTTRAETQAAKDVAANLDRTGHDAYFQRERPANL